MADIEFTTGLKVKSDFSWVPSLIPENTSSWISMPVYYSNSYDANSYYMDHFYSDTYKTLDVKKGPVGGANKALVNPGFTVTLSYNDIAALNAGATGSLHSGYFRLLSTHIEGSAYFAPDGGRYDYLHVKMGISYSATGGAGARGRYIINFQAALGNKMDDWGEDYEEASIINTVTMYLDDYFASEALYYEMPKLMIGFGLVRMAELPPAVDFPEESKLMPYVIAQSVNGVNTYQGYHGPVTPCAQMGTLTELPNQDFDTIQFDPNQSGMIVGGQFFMGAQFRFMFNMPRYFVDHGGYLPMDTVSTEVGPESGPGGGGGTFDDSSDPIDIPEEPEWGVTSVGFVRVYKPQLASLTTLGVELFPPLSYTNPGSISSNDVVNAIVDAANALITAMANIPSFFTQLTANTLINYIIDCHVIPVSPVVGNTEAIKVGSRTLTTTAPRATSDYVDVSCGSISVGEFYSNFADYISTAKLYLPFVGFVPVRPEWFQNATLAVDYRFNVIDGSFACYVRAGGEHVGRGSMTIVGQYAGVACMHIPITGTTYASMVSGLVGAGSGMVAGAATGNVATVATSAIAASQAHGDIASSNAYSSSAAFLSCRRPFLMIDRPVSSYARNYQHENGLPANIYARLGDVSGFVQMLTVHVDNISGATEKEKDEIKSLLGSGVIV